MTEIKLMNYGRGAGKTHTLKSWQLESPNHRFIVCLSALSDQYPEVPNNRLVSQILLAQDEHYFAVFQNWEVAFDNFDIASHSARDALANALRWHPKTVILATSHDTMETEAATLKTTNVCAESEPIQSVKGPDLRLGDWVVGKGYIVSLVEDDYSGTLIQTSEQSNGKYASTSTVELRYNQTIDIDITKRK